MGAREKLNSAAMSGCLTVAAVIGYSLNSFLAFVIAAIALIAVSMSDGSIRAGGRSRR